MLHHEQFSGERTRICFISYAPSPSPQFERNPKALSKHVTTSSALVTSSDALATGSNAFVTSSLLLLVVMPSVLVASKNVPLGCIACSSKVR